MDHEAAHNAVFLALLLPCPS